MGFPHMFATGRAPHSTALLTALLLTQAAPITHADARATLLDLLWAVQH